jgi:hypothetical protein
MIVSGYTTWGGGEISEINYSINNTTLTIDISPTININITEDLINIMKQNRVYNDLKNFTESYNNIQISNYIFYYNTEKKLLVDLDTELNIYFVNSRDAFFVKYRDNYYNCNFRYKYGSFNYDLIFNQLRVTNIKNSLLTYCYLNDKVNCINYLQVNNIIVDFLNDLDINLFIIHAFNKNFRESLNQNISRYLNSLDYDTLILKTNMIDNAVTTKIKEIVENNKSTYIKSDVIDSTVAEKAKKLINIDEIQKSIDKTISALITEDNVVKSINTTKTNIIEIIEDIVKILDKKINNLSFQTHNFKNNNKKLKK